MPGLAQKLVGAVNQLEGNFAFKQLQNSNLNCKLKKKVGVYKLFCSSEKEHKSLKFSATRFSYPVQTSKRFHVILR